MIKVISKLNAAIGYDGMLHIVYSAVLATLLQLVLPLSWAGPLALLVGVCKEVYDVTRKRGVCDVKDILCNCIGVGIVVANHVR